MADFRAQAAVGFFGHSFELATQLIGKEAQKDGWPGSDLLITASWNQR
jgi:hypothetical protein